MGVLVHNKTMHSAGRLRRPSLIVSVTPNGAIARIVRGRLFRLDRCRWLCASLLVLLACTQGESKTETVTQTIAPRKLAGDVFIVTKSGESVKLGLVLVSAWPESTVLKHIARVRTEAIDQLVPLERELKQARQQVDAADAERAAAVRAWDALPWPKNSSDTEGFEARDRANRRMRRAEAVLSAARQTVQAVQARIDAVGSIPFVFLGIPPSQWSAKTDADGRFQMEIPATGAFVVVATARRELINNTEEYYWIVRVPATDGQRLFLSNDNLAGIGATESLL